MLAGQGAGVKPSLFGRIVMATDFSAGAEAAWLLAQRLAAAFGSELILVHVLAEAALLGPLSSDRLREVYDAASTWATGMLEGWAEQARSNGLTVRLALPTGVLAEEIVGLASEERADLIVIGTHGRGGMKRVLLGSVADRVVRLASCPVLTVREPG